MSILATFIPYHIRVALSYSIEDALQLSQSPVIVRLQEPDYTVSFALTTVPEGDLDADWLDQVAQSMGMLDDYSI